MDIKERTAVGDLVEGGDLDTAIREWESLHIGISMDGGGLDLEVVSNDMD